MSRAPAARTADIGLIGLGVMGENLTLNILDQGHGVAVWTRTKEKVQQFLRQYPQRRLVGSHTLQELAAGLTRPRRILLMVKAGNPVDEMLEQLAPLLSPGDVVIDGGNSFFKDTQRRESAMRARGLHFVGMGVSGGEEGARLGPSLMPGGAREAYELLRPVLESIAAQTESGPCVTHVGPDGAGHFVKMVHNGIEYGIMQLIAEAYDILRRGLGLTAPQAADLFAQWNRGPLESFLIEITAIVLRARDQDTGSPLVDVILDQAGQKGTGKWTAQVALDLGIPIPTISAAIDARALSSMKAERVTASVRLASAVDRSQRHSGQPGNGELLSSLHDALHAAIVATYAQGMALLRGGSTEYTWHISLADVARIWKGGCIIRARLLDTIMHAFGREPQLANLMLDDEIAAILRRGESACRRVVHTAVACGIPVPALSASIAYFDTYRTARLPQNLIQAQRDFFGAHTYQRADRPEEGFVHTDWRALVAAPDPAAMRTR